MKTLNVLTLILVIIGAINWGLMGLFQVDLVVSLFGCPQSSLSRLIYIIVGLSGIYQLIPLISALSDDVDEMDTTATSRAAYDRAGRLDRTAYDRDTR